ncbi:lysozyme g-like isoform X2 [Poecilia reticulata]|uniref:lysozyme g-like isoform X2 n=1 Tax=Poecilia reticulata TaxID=8081 RepID=UPI0004A337F4|nr:PREDICTED: lysozyme g-like isoform X2 [Poecilia reticulata]
MCRFTKTRKLCLIACEKPALTFRTINLEAPSNCNETHTEYRNLSQMTTTGASKITKERNIDSSSMNRMTGVEVSKTLAEQDLELMSKYKTDIKSVGKALRLHPALIAAIISKQSRAGGTLDCKGYGKLDSVCFGLMQIHKDHHELKGTAFSREHIEQGSTCLIHLIKDMKNRKPDWSEEMQLKGALVGYMTGLERVPLAQPDHLDSETRTKDFSNDVIARAQFFQQKGYK